MIKNKRVLRRLFLLFLVILLIVPVAVPVAAATFPTFDYRDYVSTARVDGINEIVTISLPADFCTIGLYGADWKLIKSVNGTNFTYAYNLGYESTYYVVIDPFTSRYLSLANIPPDAKYTICWTTTLDSLSGIFQPSITYLHEVYVKDNGVVKDTVIDPYCTQDTNTYFYDHTGILQTDNDSCAFRVEMFFPAMNRNDSISVSLVSLNIQLTINSYYQVLQQMGYTEQIEDLKQQLADNGKTLDGILQSQQNAQEYIPQVSAPPVQGDLDTLQGVEDNLMNDVNAGFDKAHEFQEAAGGVITSLYIPIMAVSSLLSQLIGLDTSQIPGFYQILMVSMGLGLVGVLLNLGVNYVRSKAGDH